MLVIYLATGQRKQIPQADSVKWREGYLVCFDPAGRALASFDPDEVQSFEVVDDLPSETAADDRAEPRHLRWLKSLRRQKETGPVPNGRIERLIARIKRQREGIDIEDLSLSLLTFGDEGSDMNEWVRAAADKQKENESRAESGVDRPIADPPRSIDKHSTEELVRLLTEAGDSDAQDDAPPAEDASDSGIG